MSKKLIFVCLAIAAVAWSLPARANYASTVMASNPLAFWQFEDGASSDGSPCADTTGNHNATYRNKGSVSSGIPDISLGPGQVGNAATFNGSSGGNGNFIDIPGGNTSGLEFTTGSLEFWFKANPSSNYARPLQHNDGSGDPYGWGCMVGLSNPNQIGVFGCDTTWYTPYGDHPVENNQWHYIVVTYSYNSGSNTTTETWYNDSTMEATTTESGSLTYPSSSNDPIIGAEGNQGYIWNGMTGTLDEVAIYNYALSQAQVNSHYAAGIPEPATIALLSLGGLTLLRRKRA
jgi:hypothetical protein